MIDGDEQRSGSPERLEVILRRLGGIDDDGSGREAVNRLDGLLEVVVAAGRGRRLDPLVADALDRLSQLGRVKLRQEVGGTTATLQRRRVGQAAPQRFPAVAARTVHAEKNGSASHFFCSVSNKGSGPPGGRSFNSTWSPASGDGEVTVTSHRVDRCSIGG